MYINDNRNNKKPIAFPDIMNAKVFEFNNRIYMKAKSGAEDVAVDLLDGVIIIPANDDFKDCLLWPAAQLDLQPRHNKD